MKSLATWGPRPVGQARASFREIQKDFFSLAELLSSLIIADQWPCCRLAIQYQKIEDWRAFCCSAEHLPLCTDLDARCGHQCDVRFEGCTR